jgi:hypothetical protein
VIGSELHLEAIFRVPEGRAHDAGIGDHSIERTSVSQQSVGARAHTFEGGEIEIYKCDAAAVLDFGAGFCCRTLCLRKVAYGADDFCAMGS